MGVSFFSFSSSLRYFPINISLNNPLYLRRLPCFFRDTLQNNLTLFHFIFLLKYYQVKCMYKLSNNYSNSKKNAEFYIKIMHIAQ